MAFPTRKKLVSSMAKTLCEHFFLSLQLPSLSSIKPGYELSKFSHQGIVQIGRSKEEPYHTIPYHGTWSGWKIQLDSNEISRNHRRWTEGRLEDWPFASLSYVWMAPSFGHWRIFGPWGFLGAVKKGKENCAQKLRHGLQFGYKLARENKHWNSKSYRQNYHSKVRFENF